jgi:uncharacterized membrane protein YoaT (DUF817 family)
MERKTVTECCYIHDDAHPHTAAHIMATVHKLNSEVLDHPAYSPNQVLMIFMCLDFYTRHCKANVSQMMMRQRLCTQPNTFLFQCLSKSVDQLMKYTEKQENYAEK